MERAPAEAEALELLEQFNLADAAETLYRGLSGGEAQRLMLVRALATEPDLLLVDEPTAQLDHRTAETVNSVLQNVAGRGTIVVIATHDAGTRDSCTDSIDLLDFQ
jgi:ABC-type lipoprotein export system ATPase subunit